MVLYSTYVWGKELDAFFGRNGWNSLEVIRAYHSISFAHRSGAGSRSIDEHGASMLPGNSRSLLDRLLYSNHIRSRAFIHISYCDRALIATFGLDQICGVLLLYLAIGPSGARYSVDSLLIRLWRRTRNSNQVAESPRKFASACLATRLMQIHYCVIYFFAAIGKFQGESWWMARRFGEPSPTTNTSRST